MPGGLSYFGKQKKSNKGYCIAEERQQLMKSFMETAKDDIEKRRQTEKQLAESILSVRV